MSKVKKLVSNPRRFFEDAYKIRQKAIDENIESILHKFNNVAQPLGYGINNTKNKSNFNYKNKYSQITLLNKQMELEKFYNNLVESSY